MDICTKFAIGTAYFAKAMKIWRREYSARLGLGGN